MNILVIDDNTAVTDLFDLLVESIPSEVTKIHSSEEWFIKIKQTNPDLIILDMFSPGRADFTICEQIRDLTCAPILVVSAINSPDLIAKALNAGADDVLTKPVSKSLLTARLNGLLVRSKGCNKFFSSDISLAPFSK